MHENTSGYTHRGNGRWSSEEQGRYHTYAVMVLKHTDFVDIKELAATKIKNRTRNTDGGIVNWLNIKWLRFEKSAPHTIQYKHRIQREGFMKLVVSSERVRRRRPETTTLLQLYMRRLPISDKQKWSHEPPEQPCDTCRVQAILRRVTIIRACCCYHRRRLNSQTIIIRCKINVHWTNIIISIAQFSHCGFDPGGRTTFQLLLLTGFFMNIQKMFDGLCDFRILVILMSVCSHWRNCR